MDTSTNTRIVFIACEQGCDLDPFCFCLSQINTLYKGKIKQSLAGIPETFVIAKHSVLQSCSLIIAEKTQTISYQTDSSSGLKMRHDLPGEVTYLSETTALSLTELY